MKFRQESTNRGNTITIKGIRLIESPNTADQVYGEAIVIGGMISFRIRAICLTYISEEIAGPNMPNAAIQIFLKLQGCSKKDITHTVIVKSTALNIHRYFRVEDPVDGSEMLTLKSWHTVYDNVIHYSTWTFDIEVTLLEDNINDGLLRRSALALLDDEDTTDVELKGTDGTVRAHGCVLAAASPFMRAAFYGDFKEGAERKLAVPDADLATLKLIKQFAYMGYIEGEPSALATVYQLASRFMMPNLARACAAVLVEHLDGEGLKDLLQLESKLNEPHLLNAMIPRSDIKAKLSTTLDDNDENSRNEDL